MGSAETETEGLAAFPAVSTMQNGVLNTFSKQLEGIWSNIADKMLEGKGYDDIRKTGNCTKEWITFIIQQCVQPDNGRMRATLSMYLFNCLNPRATEHEVYLSTVNGAILELFAASRDLAGKIAKGRVSFDTSGRNSSPSSSVLEWYKDPQHAPSLAMNDVYLLGSIANTLSYKTYSKETFFRKYFKNTENLNGRTLFGIVAARTALKLERLPTMKMATYESFIKAQYSLNLFVGPFFNAMILCGIEAQEIYNQVEYLGTKLGLWHQIQKEYTYFFESDDDNDNNGMNVEHVTWFHIKAFELATANNHQIRSILMDKNVEQGQITQLFKKLSLDSVYKKFVNELGTEIEEAIKKLDPCLPKEPFEYAFQHFVKKNTGNGVQNISLRNEAQA